MVNTETVARSESNTRPAFDLFEGFATSSILAGLEMAGLLSTLEAEGLGDKAIDGLGPEAAALLRSTLRYLSQRGLVEESDGAFTLSEYGQAVCDDKGYLVWLVGGYGQPLRRVDDLLAHGQRFGEEVTRDGRWVADGAALLGRADVVPHALRLLEQVRFGSVLDLGCGNARFLLRVCEQFGARGVGVDLSAEACDQARKAVEAAGAADRVRIVRGDAADLDAIPSLGETDLVVTFFLLHEILAGGRDALVRYLIDLSSRLPAGAHLLAAEVEPPAGDGRQRELFTPEFTYVHAMMRQVLLPADGWRAAMADGGFVVQEAVASGMPGGILLLCKTPD